jgi:hypothetical protein
LALAKALNAKVTTVTVTEPWSSVLSGELTGGLGVVYSFEAHEKICAAEAKQALEAAAKLAQETGIWCETVHVKDQMWPSRFSIRGQLIGFQGLSDRRNVTNSFR